MKRKAIPTTAAVAAAILVAACGSGDKQTAATNAASTTAASQASTLPPGLAGAYSRFVSKADIERTQKKRSEVGPDQDKPKPSKMLLFFDAKAMTMRDPAAKFVTQMDYSATPDGKLLFVPDC